MSTLEIIGTSVMLSGYATLFVVLIILAVKRS